jgi:hypothetical protein
MRDSGLEVETTSTGAAQAVASGTQDAGASAIIKNSSARAARITSAVALGVLGVAAAVAAAAI